MRCKTKRKNSRNRLLAISGFSMVALAGVIAGLYGLSNASAYDSDECNQMYSNNSGLSACAAVSFDGATKIEANDGGNTVSFLVDGQNVDLYFDDERHGGSGYLNFSAEDKTLVMIEDPIYYREFYFSYAGNFEEDYYAYLTYPGGDSYARFYCNYDSYSNNSECYMSYENDYLPDGAHFILMKNENVKVYIGANAEYTDTSSGEPYANWDLGDNYAYLSSDEYGNYDDDGAYLQYPSTSYLANNLSLDLGGTDNNCPTSYRFVLKDEKDGSGQPWKTTLACTENGQYSYATLTVSLGENETMPKSDKFGVYLMQDVEPTVTISGGDGSNSFYGAHVSIDGVPVEYDNPDCEFDPEATGCADSTQKTVEYEKEVKRDGTATINFSTLFINKVTDIVINGTSYNVPFDYSDRQAWLDHYDHQLISFDIVVPAADAYDISYNVAEAPENVQIGNFLWTNEEEHKDDDNYIGHSNVELLSIQCHMTDDHADDVVITEFNEASHENCLYEFESNDVEGSLVVPSESVVTMGIVTNYGYQITSFGLNGDLVSVDPSKPSEFTFPISKGNFHIGAKVEATENEVKADSETVKAGSIELGDGEIDAGTAMLTVSDAELSEEEQKAFQSEAGDYKVTSYLNIDLDQIFYDGHGDFWKGRELKELNDEATVTLELDEGIDGNSVVIVHQKHDGGYEVIPAVYDAEAHTITFKTSSFSNYAIATTTVEKTPEDVATGDTKEDNIDNSNTLDNIKAYGVVFAVCCSAFALAIATKRAIRK